MAQQAIDVAAEHGFTAWFFSVKATLLFVAYTYVVREENQSWVPVLLLTLTISYLVWAPLRCATYGYHQVCAC